MIWGLSGLLEKAVARHSKPVVCKVVLLVMTPSELEGWEAGQLAPPSERFVIIVVRRRCGSVKENLTGYVVVSAGWLMDPARQHPTAPRLKIVETCWQCKARGGLGLDQIRQLISTAVGEERLLMSACWHSRFQKQDSSDVGLGWSRSVPTSRRQTASAQAGRARDPTQGLPTEQHHLSYISFDQTRRVARADKTAGPRFDKIFVGVER